MRTITKPVKNFEQMGSLEVIIKLIVRHQEFLLITAAVLEGTYIIVSKLTS
jgi:hypothetical protein